MGVAVDKAGHGNHAGAVNNGSRLFLRGIFGDGDDFAAFDADVGTEEHFHPFIHGHNGNVGN